MKILLLQSSLVWENPKLNRQHFQEKINESVGVDLIVLPEMFSTGFTMNPKYIAETMQGETVLWMKHLAKFKNAALTGSLVIEENGKYYNRLLFVFPSGEIKHYDKRHLFTLAGEDKIFTSGNEKLIVNFNDWKICLLVCYDLRFPVFSRNTEDYDALIYVANWPESRIFAWDSLLKARAIENISYVIGVNRVGEDANENRYNGHSQVIDCLGNYIIAPSEEENVFSAELDKKALLETRQKFGFLNDRDSFTVV